MRRLLFASSVLATVFASSAALADGGNAWMANGSMTPVEQRIAVAASPDYTTIWTSVRFDATPGSIGVVIPAPAGASLDQASDGWFEALETATAPRIFPPPGAKPYCPGQSGSPNIFSIEGDTAHVASLAPQTELLPDALAVAKWASDNNLALAPDVAVELGALTGVRFLAVRLDTQGGAVVTPTLRVSMPGKAAALPLALMRAGSQDLLVSTFFIGAGRADVTGAPGVDVANSKIVWNAKTGQSTYGEARTDTLASVAGDGTILESASHESLVVDLPIANGTASIGSVLSEFFIRASAYGDAPNDTSTCLAQAAASLSSNQVVATVCPRAALGVVDGANDCVDGTNGIAPDRLRCGPNADDLAVALSGQVPANVWLTRRTMIVSSGGAGADWGVTFPAGMPMQPLHTATSVDTSDCKTSSSSSGSGGPGSGSTGSGINVTVGSGGGGDQTSGGDDWDTGGSVDINLNAGSCDCGGDTSGTGDSSSDTCSGDGSGSSSDSCDSSSGSSSSDSCSSSSGDSSGCDSGGGSSSGCDSGGGSSGCDAGGGGGGDCGNCTIGAKRAPRASVLLMAAMAIAAPLRRRLRPKRGAKGDAKAPLKA